jgi:predicted transcriptional regulator
MSNRKVLISIHPNHVEKIISGEKRLEFRRSWAALPVDMLVIYSTAKVQQIVALAEVKHVHSGSKTSLWNLAQKIGGGISRRELFAYLDGKKTSFAIELARVKPIAGNLNPVLVFGKGFHPPQSFRYLKDEEYERLNKMVEVRL